MPVFLLFINGHGAYKYHYDNNLEFLQELIDSISPRYIEPTIESLPDGATLAQVMDMSQGKMTVIYSVYEGCEQCAEVNS